MPSGKKRKGHKMASQEEIILSLRYKAAYAGVMPDRRRRFLQLEKNNAEYKNRLLHGDTESVIVPR